MKKLFSLGETLTESVQAHYTEVAERGEAAAKGGVRVVSAGCCSTKEVYSSEELAALTSGAAAASAGCGNPVALADVRQGETVLDLGSGGGIDCFLAARSVGPAGRVIGVDMTPAMVALARKNAERMDAQNVVFKMGRIEAIPEPDSTVDMVISNCVINLSERKDLVFAEVFRVLKPGGRMVISDMVVDRELPAEVRADRRQWSACVGGADVKADYLARIRGAGFEKVEVMEDVRSMAAPEGDWRSSVRSVTVRAFRPA